MPRTKSLKYCYISPKYPTSAYAVMLFLLKDDQVHSILALNYIYNSTQEVSVEIEQLAKDASFKKDAKVSEIAVLLPLYFHNHYPLKKDFWKDPTNHYHNTDRSFAFLKLADNCRNFLLLVTPTYYDEKGKIWDLHATLPLPITCGDEVIENFMQTSDQVVDIRAKNAALYTCGKPIKFNWKTQELTPVDPSVSDNHYSVN